MLFLRRINLPVFSLLVVCGSLLVSGCNAMGRVGAGTAIGDLAFSPDGQTLMFREYKLSGERGLSFLDLGTGARKFVAAPIGYRFTGPSYSSDGRQVVAALFEAANQSQLVIMDANGGNMRELTQGRGCRADPSFSPDGGRIVFSYSQLPETRASKKCVDQDVFELDLASGQVRQLTSFKFYHLVDPGYLPDGKRFVFSGEGPRQPMKHQEYEEKFGKNFIFIMEGMGDELRPAITGYDYSSVPAISADEKIVYKVRTDDMDDTRGKYTFDLFLREGGQDRRLTKLYSTIMYHAISADGRLVAFLADSDPDRGGNYEMMIMNADGSGLRSLSISGRLF